MSVNKKTYITWGLLLAGLMVISLSLLSFTRKETNLRNSAYLLAYNAFGDYIAVKDPSVQYVRKSYTMPSSNLVIQMKPGNYIPQDLEVKAVAYRKQFLSLRRLYFSEARATKCSVFISGTDDLHTPIVGVSIKQQPN